MSVTEEIKNRLDLVDIVSEHVALRRSGRNYTGFCPFHSNTRTPAFVVFPESQTWRCFGECATGGDLFEYVMKKEGYDFKEALRVLAQRAGVTLEEPDPQTKKRRQAENKVVDLLTMAAEYFHQLFLYAPLAQQARDYVAQRHLNEETVATYHLGYALDSWDACRNHFTDQGYSDDELLAAGLLTENPDKGTRYDRFRNRLMIPIRDVENRVVGFGARTLEKDGIPKYLNSPQTAVFDKSHLLFGLDLARRHIREAREAIIVEGYMDVMQGWQAGFRNMVAQMGTALTREQLQLLSRFTRSATSRSVPRILLSLDADPAGQKATARGLEVARLALERNPKAGFESGRLRTRWQFQADMRIVVLPEGKDPDQIIRSNPEEWAALLEHAKPLINYIIDELTRNLDMSDVKAKDAIARQVMPLIWELPSELEQEQYRLMLARALETDEHTLKHVPRADVGHPAAFQTQSSVFPHHEGKQAKASEQEKEAYGPRVFSKAPSVSRESNLLRHFLEHPHMILQVNQLLMRHDQAAVRQADFTAAEDKAILSVIYERVDRTPFVTIPELCDSLDDVLANRIEQVLLAPPAPESELSRLPRKLAKSLLDRRKESVTSELAQLQQLSRDLPTHKDSAEQHLQLRSRILKLLEARQQIFRAMEALSASSQRRTEQSGHRLRRAG